MEDILIKSKEFKLPNRRDVFEDPNLEVIVVDAVESPIERPKKTKEILLRKEKEAFDQKSGNHRFSKRNNTQNKLCKWKETRFQTLQRVKISFKIRYQNIS